MKTEVQIKEELVRLEMDERLHYPTATIFGNAPLALIQVQLEAEIALLKWILEDDDKI